MKIRDVCWLQGSLVLPHHFQSQVAATQNLLNASTSWTTPFGYGVFALGLQADELKAGNIAINYLKVRLRDGTLISVPHNAHVPSVNIKSALTDAGAGGLYIYLTLPGLQPGQQNAVRVDDDTLPEDETHRYLIRQADWSDLNHENDDQLIDYYWLNARLRWNTAPQPPDGYVSIPLMHLLPPNVKAGPPQINQRFFPPLLSCGGWPPMRELLVTIQARLEAFIGRQAKALDEEHAWSQVTMPRVNRAIFMLNAANSCLPILRQMVALTETGDDGPLYVLHPYEPYVELCRLIGQLGLVTRDWQGPRPPLYNHERLGEVFHELEAMIDGLLTPYGPSAKLTRHPFTGTADWLEVTLGELAGADCRYYVGIESQLNPKQLAGLFAERHLDWKLGSRQSILRIYRNAEPGLRLTLADEDLAILPRVEGRAYFQVDACGDYWDEALKDPTLALRLNPRFVLGSFQGTNQVTVTTEDGGEQKLSFWLWVIQNENVISGQGGASDPAGA